MTGKWLLLLLLFAPAVVYAQEGYVSGKVVDSISHEPLAFVSIVYNQSGQGVVTNLEGIFRIPLSNRVQFLNLRYVGYNSKTIYYNPSLFRTNQLIPLCPLPMDIGEVIVRPSENPANRIIKLAAENRNKNNPEKSGPFSYVSYDKLVFGLEPDTTRLHAMGDTLNSPLKVKDSITFGIDRKGKIDVQRFLDKQYLFMMESVTSRKFLSPDKDKEEVIASKVSGISQPSFVVLARQFQSFSFYDNFITIADRQFINPISTGSTDKYFFLIEDTTYTERSDTVFIISFRPMKGKNFNGMKGILYINSNGYAVQNVLAEAYDQSQEKVKISIQQQYDLIDGKRWFPVLFSTTIRFNPSQFGYAAAPVDIVGKGKSYIVNINFDPQIKPSEFSDVQIEVRPDAHKQPDQVWNNYRVDSLTKKEKETYSTIDSLGKTQHLDRTITSFETILTGFLPGRYWNFDIWRFIDYDPYEGFRFGLGGRTTPYVSRLFTLAGYGAYGLKDKSFKYGGSITLNLWPAKELGLTLLYRKDVQESAGLQFNEPLIISGSAFIRDYMVEVMDKKEEAEASLNFRAFKYLTTEAYINSSILTPTNGYGFSLNDNNPQVMLTGFDITEMGTRFKYAFKETFMETPRGNKFSMGTNYPILYFNVARGSKWLKGGYNYWRTEIKITKSFRTKSFGETRMAVIAGWVDGRVPYSKLYAGIGSYKTFTLETEQSFGTMRFNEFLSNGFLALFIKQDFGKLLFKPRGKFQPEIALVHNIGFGKLENSSLHKNIDFKTMEKGYYEGGILINNIFRISLLKYGVGAMYRYGPYSFPKTIDNFAFKLTLQINL